MCKQTVFCSVCGFSPGAVTELASPQLHTLSLKAHLQRPHSLWAPAVIIHSGCQALLAHWQTGRAGTVRGRRSQVLRACKAELLLGLSGF